MDTKRQLGEETHRLYEIMKKLRSQGGCPWDREQDHLTLRPYLIEEAYEVLEAIEEGDDLKLQEELGDLLLQVVFHAQIANERGKFDLADVEAGISTKLERRHPHVFGQVKVDGVDGVLLNWEKIKAVEKPGARKSLLDGIPKDLPALQYAEKIQSKAAKVGFEWENIQGAWAKIEEEMAELSEQIEAKQHDSSKLEDELGDLLFAVVNVARYLKIHPEQALRGTITKFERRFKFIEEAAARKGKELTDMDLSEMDALWERAKASE